MPHLFSHHHRESGESSSHSTHSRHHHSSTHENQSEGSHHPDSQSSPHTAAHDGGNPLQQHYREALPSRLDAKFQGRPVTGTAIITDELPDFLRNESEYELVTPQRTELLGAYAEAVLNANRGSVTSETASNTATLSPSTAAGAEEESGAYSSHGTASVSSASRRKHGKKAKAAQEAEEKRRKQLEAHPHQVLKEGGYVIFSEKYVREHPESAAAQVTLKYVGTNPPEQAPELDPSLPEDKRINEKAKYLIEQSEGDHLPLFRLRTASAVYGSASYEPSDPSGTDTLADDSAAATPVPSLRE